MKKILVLALVVFSCIGLIAESDGEKGFKSLTFTTNADEAAQGGTGSFSSTGALNFLNNPTATLFDRNVVASINQNYWLFDTNMNSFGIRNSRDKIAYGFGFRYLDYQELEGRDEIGIFTGDFAPMDLALTGNIAFKITPDHYLGLNTSLIYEKIETASSYGLAVDLGYTFLTPLKDLIFSAAVKNIGTSSKMDEEKIELPTSFEVSLAKKINRLNGEFKLLKINDDDSFKAALGGNYLLTDNFTLRAGYKFGYDTENLSAGFGVRLKKVSLDYAFVAFSDELDNAHMIGLNYKF